MSRLHYATIAHSFGGGEPRGTGGGALKQLELDVAHAIEEGWRPLGGIAVSINSVGKGLVAQAMTKEEQ